VKARNDAKRARTKGKNQGGQQPGEGIVGKGPPAINLVAA
jgi:hypothetical protein